MKAILRVELGDERVQRWPAQCLRLAHAVAQAGLDRAVKLLSVGEEPPAQGIGDTRDGTYGAGEKNAHRGTRSVVGGTQDVLELVEDQHRRLARDPTSRRNGVDERSPTGFGVGARRLAAFLGHELFDQPSGKTWLGWMADHGNAMTGVAQPGNDAGGEQRRLTRAGRSV